MHRRLNLSLFMAAAFHLGCSSGDTSGATSTASGSGGHGGGQSATGSTSGGGQGGAGSSSTASGGSSSATGTGGGPTNQAWKCPAGNFQSPNLNGLSAKKIAGVPPADGFSPGYSVLEGPLWLGDALYLSDIATDSKPPVARLLQLLPATSTVSIAAATIGSNGLAADKDGNIVAGVHKDGSISRFSVKNLSNPTPIAGSFMGARFNSPNDLAVRSDGNIYFSDPDYQAPAPSPQAKTRVYRIAPGGAVSVIDDTINNPNGVTLSLDESTLYVTGTSGLYTYPVMADGSVGAGKLLNGALGGDGMVMDCAGDLYVTGTQNVVVLNPAGTDIGHIAVGGVNGVDATTNVAFGGPDRKTLFITTRGSTPALFSVDLGVPGMPY